MNKPEALSSVVFDHPASVMRSRSGVTLVELLVVIAVAAILIALTSIAVQSTRESARRMECQNRLRQLAIASSHFVATHRHFPSNGWGFHWVGQLDRGVGPSQPGGWAFQMLPFVEISLEKDDGQNADMVRAGWTKLSFSAFRCPSRPAGDWGPHSQVFQPINTTPLTEIARTDFAICEGDFITQTMRGPRSISEGDSKTYHWTDVSRATGVSFQRSAVRPSQVVDGLSSTYLIGEKHVSNEHYFDGKDLGYDQSLLSGVDLDLNRWVISPPARDDTAGVGRTFGSSHSKGCNISQCDGSVRLISYGIDGITHARLGNRQDGKSVSLPK